MVAERLSNEGVDVSVYTEEPYGFYSRIKLPQLLCNEAGLTALPSTREPSYLVHDAVCHIDREKRQLVLADGERTSYDALVIATGSRGRVIDPFGDTEGVSTLRTLEDALRIGQWIADPVVVLGGGLLGLEAALAIQKKGFSVTVCEATPRILVRQLDTQASSMLKARLQSDGMQILEGVRATGKQLDAGGRIAALELEGRKPLPCSTLVLSLGVNPETTLAREASLTVDRGIVVDGELRTSDPNVFAIGDCAQFQGQVPGILPVAIQMAQCVTATLLGSSKEYVPPVLMTRFKDDGLDVVSVGDVSGDSAHMRSDDRYEAYFTEGGILIGAILFGNTEHLSFVRSHYLKPVTFGEIASMLDF
jgi:nitrite reductase (NADH) large subunit